MRQEGVLLPNGIVYLVGIPETAAETPTSTEGKAILALGRRVADLSDLIREAAPLAWATGRFDNDAHKWEKKAKKLLDNY